MFNILCRSCIALALLVAVSSPAPAAAPATAPEPKAGQAKAAPVKGSLVIIGGSLRAGNTPVWERIVALAGGKGARIAVFPSAANIPDRAGKIDVERLRAYGADAFLVPVSVKLAGTDYRQAADDAELAKQVREAGGAYFVGGDQARITQALRRADGANTLVLDALWEMYRRGGVIAGTSAGAAIMSSTMFNEAKPVLDTLKLGVNDGRALAPGLGFIGEHVFVDQHLLVRGRFARMLPAMLHKGYKLGLGIDENTAMIVGPDREVEVLGYAGALLIELGAATVDRFHPGFNLSNARMSYLDNGDRYNLATGVFTPSADKVAGGKTDPAKPYYRESLFSADILGHTTVAQLMKKLVDSDQAEAVGIAFGGPKDVRPEQGFEFRFTMVPESVGYNSAVSDAVSVFKLRMDIRPIEIRQPVYQYK
ncbi:MAG: cyanophycinase [Pseudomonadota bacterium]